MNRRAFVVASMSLLAACGGGGGGSRSSGPAAAPNPAVFPQLPVAALPEPTIGVNVHASSATAVLPLLLELDVRHVRTSWWWYSEVRDWSWIDAYRGAGIEVMPLVAGGPNRTTAAQYDRLRAAHGSFPWVQIENEWDHERSRGLGGADGGYFRGVAEHIKARDPDTKVCGMALGWTQPWVRDYMRAMLNACGEVLDAAAIHVYGHHPYGEPLSRWEHARAAGWEGPIWATEFGQGDLSTRAYHGFAELTSAQLDAFQAECYRRTIREDEGRHGWSRIYAYHFGHSPEDGYGLLRADGSLRPAAEWLRAWKG